MAIDTADKRASAVHVGLPWRALLPLADAPAEDQGDRQQVAGFYRGILAGGAVAATAFGDLTTLFSGYMADLRHDHPTRNDTETLIAHDLATVRAATSGETDDAATMYAKYLS